MGSTASNKTLKHYGVRGMKWKKGTLQPQQPMGSLGARIGDTGTLGDRIGGTGRMDQKPNSDWRMSPESKAANRAKMAEIAALFQKKPPIMQQKFSAVSDKSLNPEQRKAVEDFLKKRGIS